MRLIPLSLLLLIMVLLSCCNDKFEEDPLLKNGITDTTNTTYSENTLVDTTLANHYFSVGKKLADEAEYDSSSLYFSKAREIYEKVGKINPNELIFEKLIQTHFFLGINLIYKGEYDSSFAYLNQVLKICIENLGETHPKTATIYHGLGKALTGIGDYSLSLEHLNKSLSIRRKFFEDSHIDIVENICDIGYVYFHQGEYDQALEFYNKVLQLANGEKNRIVADAYTGFAYVYFNQNHYEDALNYHEKSLTLKRELFGEKHPNMAINYQGIGILHNRKGNFDIAYSHLNQSLNLQLKALGEKHPLLAHDYYNLGSIYYRKGDYDQALIYQTKALIIRIETLGGEHPIVAESYNSIGGIYLYKKKYDKALINFENALNIWVNEFGELHPYVAHCYNNIGIIFTKQTKYDQALKYHNKALNIRLKVFGANHPDIAMSNFNIAETYYSNDMYDKALVRYTKALEIDRSVVGEKHQYVAEDYLKIGSTLRKQGNYLKALENIQKSIVSLVIGYSDYNIYSNPELKNIISQTSLQDALAEKALTFRKLFEQNPANFAYLLSSINCYEKTLQLIDQIRISYKAEGSKLLLLDKGRKIYNAAINSVLKAYDVKLDIQYKKQAFLFSDKSKSAVLYDAIQESRAKKFVGIPDDLLIKERNIRIDLAFYESEIQKEKIKKSNQDTLKIRDFEKLFFELNKEYEDLIATLETSYPRYYNLKYRTNTTTVEELQVALDEKTVLVEYFVGDETSYIFTITQNEFYVKSATLDDTLLSERVTAFRNSITNENYTSFLKNGYQLYETLFAPISDQIKSKNIIVVPDGALVNLPFEALLTQPMSVDSSKEDYRKLPYLIRDHSISYAYSATLLLDMIKQDYKAPSQELLAYAPIFKGAFPDSSRAGEIVRSQQASDTTRNFNTYLPNTRKEVAGIEEVFSNRYNILEQLYNWVLDEKCQIHLEENANEENLKAQELSDYRYLHFATHGILNDEAPILSGLILYPDPTSGEDGVLNLGETYNLDLNADLVTLSACNTGLGTYARGEGLIGLTRGFLYAGARNLLVSLWQVNDESTADFMITFYEKMITGSTKTDALKTAKLDFIKKNPEYAIPRYWASFILIGR